MSKTFNIGIGMMSGTSLDGLDLALCHFQNNSFELMKFKSLGYSSAWRSRLKSAHLCSARELALLENEYSELVANSINDLLKEVDIRPQFLSCHGHTIFHEPHLGMTYQMLNGSIVAAKTGITTICDFRTGDVAMGGQGAPLVPIGDRLLFGKYSACLNIGGFANISFEEEGNRIAYDIAPANIVLNDLAGYLGHEYDDEGKLAKAGKTDVDLLKKLDRLPFYTLSPPKSLGREWVEKEFNPLLFSSGLSCEDLLSTCTAHIAGIIGSALNPLGGEVLCTGGGVFNRYLMDLIEESSGVNILIPKKEIIEAKEAIVFALLGKLRLEGKTNTLKSVTGARADGSHGAIYPMI